MNSPAFINNLKHFLLLECVLHSFSIFHIHSWQPIPYLHSYFYTAFDFPKKFCLTYDRRWRLSFHKVSELLYRQLRPQQEFQSYFRSFPPTVLKVLFRLTHSFSVLTSILYQSPVLLPVSNVSKGFLHISKALCKVTFISPASSTSSFICSICKFPSGVEISHNNSVRS